MKLNAVTLAALAVIAVFFARAAWNQPWTKAHVFGVCILVPALVLFVTARIQLGRAFSIQAKASELVTTGVYARIRNPIYVSGALLILGLAVWSGQWWLLLILAVLIPLQIIRSRKESQVLEAKFGDAYREYKYKTWF
jgi:protein-S-isoprenylcysteine O-methyltransferase Ste14